MRDLLSLIGSTAQNVPNGRSFVAVPKVAAIMAKNAMIADITRYYRDSKLTEDQRMLR